MFKCKILCDVVQVPSLLHQLSQLLSRKPDARINKMLTKFFGPLLDMAVDALQFVDGDISSLSTLNSVVFLTSLFRYLSQFKIDDRQSDDSSAMLMKVVRANVDKCDAVCRSLMLVLFVTKGDDAVTTQAVVLALQHLLLVCPETAEFVLQLQVRINFINVHKIEILEHLKCAGQNLLLVIF